MMFSDFVECGLFLESSVDIYEKNLKVLLKQKEKKAGNPNMEMVSLFFCFIEKADLTQLWTALGLESPQST